MLLNPGIKVRHLKEKTYWISNFFEHFLNLGFLSGHHFEKKMWMKLANESVATLVCPVHMFSCLLTFKSVHNYVCYTMAKFIYMYITLTHIYMYIYINIWTGDWYFYVWRSWSAKIYRILPLTDEIGSSLHFLNRNYVKMLTY